MASSAYYYHVVDFEGSADGLKMEYSKMRWF